MSRGLRLRKALVNKIDDVLGGRAGEEDFGDPGLLEGFAEPVCQSPLGKEAIRDNERSLQPQALQQLPGFFERAASDAENSRQSDFRNHLTQR